jgi:hypothetical protein
MKQLLTTFRPVFTPGAAGAGTLDFTGYRGFSINKLYAVINMTQNTVIYIPGAPNLGYTALANGTVITLATSTATHNPGDQLNVFYDTAPGVESGFAAEQGGQLQISQEALTSMLVELQVHSFILAQGLNINMDDVNQFRADLTNTATQEFRQ